MSESVPAYVTCRGGLVLNSNKFSLLDTPGVATQLTNFEIALNGGYRRINGYLKYGSTSATRPNGDTPILGVVPYALGVIVCAGTDVFYSEDGITWLQINKDTGESGVTQANLAAQTTLSRTSQGQASFVIAKGTVDHATNPYGVAYIATGPNKVAHFHITGTGGSRTFTYTEIDAPAAGKYIEEFDHHLCIVDTTNAPNTVYYSADDDFDDYTGVGSGKATLSEQIVGIKAFRNELYIFGRNSINKLTNINDPARTEVVPVSENLGCVSGYSIQEIGGDLIYLSNDGFRTIAGTQRIGDVELGSVSKTIQPLIKTIVEAANVYTFSSTVLREKSQYRLYYINSSGVGNGLTGTLKQDEYGNLGYEWTELRDINVEVVGSGFNNDGIEATYHGSIDGYVYNHDTGNSFDGDNIVAIYEGPYTHYGDLGLRKTLHYMNLAVTNEGVLSLNLGIKFDFRAENVMQPNTITFSLAQGQALYGSAEYAAAVYGVSSLPFLRQPLQGSGHSISARFSSDDTNAPYTIHGYHIELMPSGRK